MAMLLSSPAAYGVALVLTSADASPMQATGSQQPQCAAEGCWQLPIWLAWRCLQGKPAAPADHKRIGLLPADASTP